MDKRIPHRLREIRLRMKDAGQLVSTDSLSHELLRCHPEYVRLKQQPLRRLIAQEMSVPLAPPAAAATEATAPENAESRQAKKRRRREEAAGASPVADDEPKDPSDLNGSLRKMYNPEAAGAASEALEARAAQTAKLARQRVERSAMADARKQAGLSNPSNSKTFEALERPEERLDDLGGIDSILNDLKQLVVYPLTHQEVFFPSWRQATNWCVIAWPSRLGKVYTCKRTGGDNRGTFFQDSCHRDCFWPLR